MLAQQDARLYRIVFQMFSCESTFGARQAEYRDCTDNPSEARAQTGKGCVALLFKTRRYFGDRLHAYALARHLRDVLQ